MRRLHTTFILLASLFVLAACGGGGAEDDSPSVAGGGIGGTGTGTITGFGSLILNGDQHYQVNENTRITMDDSEIGESELQAEGMGMVANVDFYLEEGEDYTAATATAVRAMHLVKGPLTSIEPLQALGQSVVATGDTVLPDGLVLDNLVVGDIVEVSGYPDPELPIRATRIELEPSGVETWQLVGFVHTVSAKTFMIGAQKVDFSAVTPRDCGGGLANGDLVKVKAAPDPEFEPGVTLTTVTDVECLPAALVVPDDAEPILIAALEGIVTSAALPDFTIGEQQVRITEATYIEGGGSEDIVPGAKVEVAGLLDTITGVLTADRVRFREIRVRIIAPVASSDIIAGEALTILGILVMATPLTQDENSTIATETGDVQVEVNAFRDSSGGIFATRIRKVGSMDFDDVRLRGPVSAVGERPVFWLLGVRVNTAETLLLDWLGAVIGQEEFFHRIAQGSLVDVEHGAYDAEGNTISAGSSEMTTIRIKD